jgi:AAHS family 4-hydroxybenzoate transporter-like MFS transporter
MARQSVDVAQLIDERPIASFHVWLVAFAFAIIMSDGYDITAIAYAAPELLKQWAITDRSLLGPVFSASLVGILVGSPLFGFIGDRHGRKLAAIGSLAAFGAFTLAAAWAGSLDQMLVLRALGGLGLGGLLPNMIALTGEFAPRRFRATLIIVMYCGVTLGGALPAAISVWLVPRYGWQSIFVIGGLLPLALAVCAWLWLPESVKFLVVRKRREEAVRILAMAAPDADIGPQTVLLPPVETVYAGFNPKHLFSEGLAVITPLLWLCFAINTMGLNFLIAWMPTLLIGQNLLAQPDAAIVTSLVQIGGTIGGLAVCRPMERQGFWPVAFLFAGAIPFVALIGYAAATSTSFLMAVVFIAGFCILGLQFGLNAASAMIYPTSVRSNGSGWAFGVGRFGSILGPYVGGKLIALNLSVPALFVLAAIPFVVGTVACIALAALYAAKFRGAGLGERDVTAKSRVVRPIDSASEICGA